MYVYQLAKEIIKNGHECLVVSISDNLKNSTFEDVPIEYIPFEKNTYDDTNNPNNLEALLEIVQRFKPDLFHLHTYTPTIGISHLKAIKSEGVKVYFTAHLPSLTCLRGDLMFHGEKACDGIMEATKCMNCYISTSSYKPIAKLAFKTFYSLSLFKSKFKALQLFDIKLATLNSLRKILDKLVVVSEWQKEVLLKNGLRSDEVVVSRQAIFSENYLESKQIDISSPLKIGFIGRIVFVKGLHILLRSLESLATSNYELHIAAIKANNELEYYKDVRAKSKNVNAIWNEDLSSNQIVEFLDSIDLLVIPSILLETGPYTAFEALSRKVPILSFNYGGVAELINDGNNGFLANSETDFRNKLTNLIHNKSLLIPISENIKYERDATLIYDEMMALYNSKI